VHEKFVAEQYLTSGPKFWLKEPLLIHPCTPLVIPNPEKGRVLGAFQPMQAKDEVGS
jgi:hypothetical protein